MERYWEGLRRDYPEYPYRDELWACGMDKKEALELAAQVRKSGACTTIEKGHRVAIR